MCLESNIDFTNYLVQEDGNIFLKNKGRFMSNKNAHPYVLNEYTVKGGGGTTFQRHRVVWYYYNGDIPDGLQIDHINGNKLDNRLENLRCLSPYANTHNENTYQNFLDAVKSEEHRKKLSKALTGRKMSKETYEKCNQTMFKKGHKVDECIKGKISDANSKCVVQIDKNGKITEWKSASEAGKKLSINNTSISRCCVGGSFDKRRGKWVKCEQYKDCKWMYREDYEKMLLEQL